MHTQWLFSLEDCLPLTWLLSWSLGQTMKLSVIRRANLSTVIISESIIPQTRVSPSLCTFLPLPLSYCRCFPPLLLHIELNRFEGNSADQWETFVHHSCFLLFLHLLHYQLPCFLHLPIFQELYLPFCNFLIVCVDDIVSESYHFCCCWFEIV